MDCCAKEKHEASEVEKKEQQNCPRCGSKSKKVSVMTCAMCSAMIKNKLSSLCTAASIDHKSGDGQCTYETGKTNQDTIVKTVTDAGYKVVEAH